MNLPKVYAVWHAKSMTYDLLYNADDELCDGGFTSIDEVRYYCDRQELEYDGERSY